MSKGLSKLSEGQSSLKLGLIQKKNPIAKTKGFRFFPSDQDRLTKILNRIQAQEDRVCLTEVDVIRCLLKCADKISTKDLQDNLEVIRR